MKRKGREKRAGKASGVTCAAGCYMCRGTLRRDSSVSDWALYLLNISKQYEQPVDNLGAGVYMDVIASHFWDTAASAPPRLQTTRHYVKQNRKPRTIFHLESSRPRDEKMGPRVLMKSCILRRRSDIRWAICCSCRSCSSRPHK